MSDFFDKLNKKMTEMLEDEDSVLSKTKEQLSGQTITIPITDEMLLFLFEKKRIRNIEHLYIRIDDGAIVIKGIARKMVLFRFSIVLQPIKAEGRSLYFTVRDLRPLNKGWLKRKVFHRPPYCTYQNEEFCVDLNSIEQIRAIPLGVIKNFEAREDQLLVTLGL